MGIRDVSNVQGSFIGSEHVQLARAAEAFARIFAAIEEGRLPVTPRGRARPLSPPPSFSLADEAAGAAGAAEAAPSAVALLVDDAHHLDSGSWYILEALREECPRLANAPAAAPPPAAKPPEGNVNGGGNGEAEVPPPSRRFISRLEKLKL
eukprot:tig00000282_g23836.t1